MKLFHVAIACTIALCALLTSSYAFAQSADLAVSKSNTPETVVAGENLTYTITITNNGSDDAVDVELNDVLPANTTFQSLVAEAGWTSTTPDVGLNGTVKCTIATLAAGASATFTIVVKVDCMTDNGAAIANTVTVGSATPDPDSANNTASSSATVTKCQRGQGYWEQNLSVWPQATLTLGCKEYTQPQLVALLKLSSQVGNKKADASIIALKQLIAAKLNYLNGCCPIQEVTDAIAAIDAIFAAKGCENLLPYKVPTNSPDGKALVINAAVLDSYNNGCIPCPPVAP